MTKTDFLSLKAERGDEGEVLGTHHKTIVLDDTNGEKTICEAHDVFTRIGSGFKKLKINHVKKPTSKMVVIILDTEGDLSRQLIGGPKRYCLSQHQIRNICKHHRGELVANLRNNIFIFEEGASFHLCKVCTSGEDVITEHLPYSNQILITNSSYRLFIRKQ